MDLGPQPAVFEPHISQAYIVSLVILTTAFGCVTLTDIKSPLSAVQLSS